MRERRGVWLGVGVAVLALLAGSAGTSQADVVHRYSFNGTDASDSVGGEDGALMGNAVVMGGQVVLDGTTGTYVNLPIGDTLAGLTDVTFETWVTWGQTTGQAWSRIFDFGNDPTTNMFLTPRNGSNNVPRFALTAGGGAGAEQQVQAAQPLATGVPVHLAVTIDSVNQVATLYVNGQIQAAIYGYTNTPSAMGFTFNNNLGKSQYNDPYFIGSIDEFRIYDFALSASQVAASFAGGPDGTPP